MSRAAGVDAVATPIRHREDVMGTVVSFLVHPGSARAAESGQAIARSCAELHRLDDVLSLWKPGSPASRLRRGELEPDSQPVELAAVLARCAEARRIALGWFDPWTMPGGLDPTGLAKGWVIEQGLRILAESGVEVALVNGGGDIASLGAPEGEGAFRVGIRHPWRKDALAAVVELSGGEAVATSGTYERGEHLIDPFTGAPPERRPGERIVSASAIGSSLAIADALATAIAVATPQAAQAIAESAEDEGYLCYWILESGSERSSTAFPFAREGGGAPEASGRPAAQGSD